MDKIVFMGETHPNKVLEGLNRLRLNNSFCDVIICCGGKEFPCHRNVLAAFSPYFEAMFTTGMMESREHRVNINEVQPEEFAMLVNYSYTSTVEISTENVQALLTAANLFNVTGVKEACSRFLDLRILDEQNCVGIHLFAEIHSCKTLAQHSMDYILDHFSDVCQQEEFLSLSVDKLTEVLASDDLNVPKEEIVFEAAMLWLNKCPTRRQSLEKVFEPIRLPLISPSYLHDVIESVDVVKESQGCQRLISEAKNQHLLPSCHTAQPRSSTVILMVGGQNDYGFALDDVDCFDPLTKRWKTLKCLPESVISLGLVVLGWSSKKKMDKIVFMGETHPNKVLEGLNRLRLNNSFCDVIICCGGKEFPCHRNVLAAFSPYFEAMFTTGMMESREHRVNINEVQPEEFAMLVNYSYTSTVEISTENVQALLTAANLFNVTGVKEACSRFLDLRILDEQNCVGIHLFAEIHSCKTLAQHSMDYILDHFSDVCQQEEFLSLSVDKLTEVLASDDLNVPKEEIVFEAAMLWLNKCPTRRQSLEKVFEPIRLPLISPSYLHDVIESVDVVKESQGCQRLISEARNQHLLPSCHTAQPRSSTVILMVGGQNDYGFALDDVDCFDPLTTRWKTLKSLPESVISLGLVVLGSTVYMAGAESYAALSSIWRYDPSHDSWLKMASMNEGRNGLGVVALGGYVYAVGGFLHNKPMTSVERYDPYTNTWQLMECVGMPEYPRSTSVVTLDGLIYVIGGTICHRKVHTYNPETSVWTEVAPMQVLCRNPTACTYKGKIYAIGGRHISNSPPLDKVECYNPKTNEWTMCACMKKPHCLPSVAVVNGKIYVLGGETVSGYAERTIERYCEQTDTWEIVGEMPPRRHLLSCVALRSAVWPSHRLQMTDVLPQ